MNGSLDARLVAAADPSEGADWADVRRRAERLRHKRTTSRRVLLALALAAALALLASIPALGLGERLLDLLSLSESGELVPTPPDGDIPPLPYVYGNVFFDVPGGPQTLAQPVLAPLLDDDATLALLSPDGRRLAYHAWSRETKTPSLRIVDLGTGADVLLERNAQSLAWRADGMLAYWRAEGARRLEQRPYVGRVLVRSQIGRAPEIWTPASGPYVVSAWARDSLLVTAAVCNICRRTPLEPGVYAFDGPGRPRALGLSHLSALSPDGRLALGGFEPSPGQDSPSPFVRVVDVASGEPITTLDLRRAARGDVRRSWLAAGIDEASWVGDRIVAVASMGNASVLVLLRFRENRLEVGGVLRLDKASLPRGYGPFFGAPLALDQEGRVVAVRVDVPPRGRGRWFAAFLTCDLEAARCRLGKPIQPGRVLSVLSNPSRPRARTG